MSDLDRFVEAQDGGVYKRALDELRAGRKRTHWMWFVFPQLHGLGQSSTARLFALGSLEEAQEYLDHPVLGPRLVEAAEAVTAHAQRRPEDVLGEVDAMKLRSSMTLFAHASPGEPAFPAVLDQWYGGAEDPATLRLL